MPKEFDVKTDVIALVKSEGLVYWKTTSPSDFHPVLCRARQIFGYLLPIVNSIVYLKYATEYDVDEHINATSHHFLSRG